MGRKAKEEEEICNIFKQAPGVLCLERTWGQAGKVHIMVPEASLEQAVWKCDPVCGQMKEDRQ